MGNSFGGYATSGNRSNSFFSGRGIEIGKSGFDVGFVGFVAGVDEVLVVAIAASLLVSVLAAVLETGVDFVLEYGAFNGVICLVLVELAAGIVVDCALRCVID